jgi:hypothetical protein
MYNGIQKILTKRGTERNEVRAISGDHERGEGNGKGKAIPLQASTGPYGSQISRQSAHVGGKVVTGHL